MIKFDERGEKVKELQIQLSEFGIDPGPIDGIFGPLTLSAWTEFKHKYLIDCKTVTEEEFNELKRLNSNIEKTKFESKGVPGWLELFDLSLHKDFEAVAPKGAYIRGKIGGQTKFEPLSDVLGNVWEKPSLSNLTPGWVELKTISFHHDMDAVSPTKPYIRGEFDVNGHFYPINGIIGLDEKERKGKKETGQKNNWYLDAEIIDKPLKTRGIYPNGYPVGAIVHYTCGRSLKGDSDAISTINWGRKQGFAYFTISNTGKVFQAHPLDEWGHHAGESFWPELGGNVSQKLVGIEICCAGKLTKLSSNAFESWFEEIYKAHLVRYSEKIDNIKEGCYHKFTENQEKSLIDLLIWLKSNNPEVFSFDYVLGHDEVAPNRKSDPGASLSMTMPSFRKYLKNLYGNAC